MVIAVAIGLEIGACAISGLINFFHTAAIPIFMAMASVCLFTH